MKWLFIVFVECFRGTCAGSNNGVSQSTCRFSNCYEDDKNPVCGIRNEPGGVRLRVFENECKLHLYACRVVKTEAYTLVNTDYCDRVFDVDNTTAINSDIGVDSYPPAATDAEAPPHCNAFHCPGENTQRICAVRIDGDGYRIRLFQNECEMLRHNCRRNSNFSLTDLFICQDLEATSDDAANENLLIEPVKPKLEHIIVVNANSMTFRRDLNASVEDFFAATHRTPLSLDEMPPETRRNMVLKTASPVVIFKPWVRVPKNKSDDHWHRPTLSSCYHKCPVKCPDTYTPVCGVPGVAAREPSLIFQNHCYMDKAQCKMFWENKSPTSESSNYVEGSFIFCLGDELTSLYRFLPLIKSLQRMGRLKQRGKFRYKLRNLKLLNNILLRNPKIMG